MFKMEMDTVAINIQKKHISPDIPRVQFACDLSACKGACCTMPGGLGAPLLQQETDEIANAYPIIKKYLSPSHRDAIERQGLCEIRYGAFTTPCVNRRACAFVTYEGAVAKCAFEKAYFKGEIAWRKPISCHLFPLRVDYGLHQRLRYEKIVECDPARERGEREQVYLSDFLRESLIRVYGEPWYREFHAACESIRISKQVQTP